MSRASATARYFAGFRAAETARPERERLVDDPIARQFLPALFRVLPARLVFRAFDAVFAGIATYGVCRSRAAEDAIRATDARQVVVLGAGFETLAWRSARSDLVFFEVDQEATQDEKRRRLERAGVAIPPGLHFVRADLRRKGWKDALREAGFRRTVRTLYLALGLLMYLEAASIDEIVHLVAISAPGSRMLFDFVPPEVAEGRSRSRGARLGPMLARIRGEAFRSGIEPTEMACFCSIRGLSLVELLDAAAISARFRRAPIPDYVRLAAAETRAPY